MAQAHRKTWKGAAIAAPQAATISPIFSQFTSSLPGLTAAGAGTTFCFIPQRSYTTTLGNRHHSRGLRDTRSVGPSDLETHFHVICKRCGGNVSVLKIAPVQRN